jgi:hypothetical protein
MVLHIDVGPHLPNRWSRPRDHAWEGDAALARRRTWGVGCGAWSARKSPRCRVHGKRIWCCIFGCTTNASVLQSMMVLHIDKGPHMSNAWNTPLGHETTSEGDAAWARQRTGGAGGGASGARQSPRCVAEWGRQSHARTHRGHSSRWLPTHPPGWGSHSPWWAPAVATTTALRTESSGGTRAHVVART